MEYGLFGAVLMGGGLIGVWMADLRSRQLRELTPFSEAIRNIAVFYDGLVVPGALLLLVSGTWLIVQFHDGWNFLWTPWLAGMVGLFAFEFIEGNTVTRLYFMRMRRLMRTALRRGRADIYAFPRPADPVRDHCAWRDAARNVDRLFRWFAYCDCHCSGYDPTHSPTLSVGFGDSAALD
jgi:hypothetical protein